MAKFSVKKPLTVFVVVLAIVVLGVVAYLRMTPDLLPNMDFPYVVIVTTDPGASPESVEETITRPMEQSMATLDRIKTVTSTTQNSVSMVMLEFEDGVNMDTISVDDNMLEELDARDSCAKVRRCVKRCLDEREAMIITLRYGLNARPPLTQREIAAQCGISRSYVSRRGYCKRGGGCLRGPGRPGRRRHPHCGVRAGKASFSEGGPECRTCGRHQHQWYSQLSGYRRYPATRSMNTLLEGLRVRCRPARVSRRLWSSSFQQSPITVRTARSTAIEVVWNCLAVSR